MFREVFGGALPLPNPPAEGRPGLAHALRAAGARTILPDMRGFGASDKPREKEAYADSAMARDVLALIEHLRLDAVGRDRFLDGMRHDRTTAHAAPVPGEIRHSGRRRRFRHWNLGAGQKIEDSHLRGRLGPILADARKTNSSKNIFRVGAAYLKELASVESAVLSNGSSVGSDFLLNGLPWSINVFGEARHANLIKPVVNIASRHQIPHRRFQGFVSHPVLNRSHIEAGTEHARGIRRTKCL